MNLEQLVDFRLGSVDVRAREWLRKNTIRIAKQTYGSVFIGQAQAKDMSDRYIKSIKLKSLNNDLINKVIKLAKNKNYKSKSEVYDFFVNYSLNKFDLKLKNIPNILI